MTTWRIDGGSEIDRSKPIGFTFEGRAIRGFDGDTIASALLANGMRVVGRSFKYHRPRGVWGASVEEPNAIVDVSGGNRPAPNVRATTEPAQDGVMVRSVNCSPSALFDRKGYIDHFARFIPAAFYYKTFMWPDWHVFEPRIRAMAGLGTIDPAWTAAAFADQVNHHCDLLVIGAGPAGLAAASVAASMGRSVMLADDQRAPGGKLRYQKAEIDGVPGAAWVDEIIARLRVANCTVLPDTTAFGIYDHNLVALSQRQGDNPDTLWRVRPREIVLATGAIERPLARFRQQRPAWHHVG
ncbi:2Fe-2S iron-sulfur cluster-binding protein [Mesorhizobium sp.]|uniref:2Fe-2S iron-sulfur cluster-binding protein n=1 Tax=Mesorhizobium sp. TaxID=1871066 RepID=UPI00257D67CE|nr:2Fe-2S iron-sulfur cluster-binding protein [Mesorhizobium sp.]